MTITREKLERLLPHAARWAAEEAGRGVRRGKLLNLSGRDLAERAGIKRPDLVRLVFVAEMPFPEDGDLAEVAREFGMITADTAGLTIGYCVFIKGRLNWGLLAHELRHVAQYEEAGGIANFLAIFLEQAVQHGHRDAPLEISAREFAREEIARRA